jgi:hypothetical protein
MSCVVVINWFEGVEWWVRNELGVCGWLIGERGWTWNLDGTFRLVCGEGFGSTLRSLREIWTSEKGMRIIRARSEGKGELL